jgi:hypothetical protein
LSCILTNIILIYTDLTGSPEKRSAGARFNNEVSEVLFFTTSARTEDAGTYACIATSGQGLPDEQPLRKRQIDPGFTERRISLEVEGT